MDPSTTLVDILTADFGPCIISFINTRQLLNLCQVCRHLNVTIKKTFYEYAKLILTTKNMNSQYNFGTIEIDQLKPSKQFMEKFVHVTFNKYPNFDIIHGPTLLSLCLKSVNLENQTFPPLPKLTKLQILNAGVTVTNINNDLLIGPLTTLRFLEFIDDNLSDNALTKLTNLETLKFSICPSSVTTNGINCLFNLKKFTIGLSSNKINVAGLNNLSKLKKLNISGGIYIRPSIFDGIVPYQLTKFKCNHCHLTDRFVEQQSLLEILDLGANSYAYNCAAISGLTNLHKLVVKFATDLSLDPLTKLTHLECYPTEQVVEMVNHLPKLQTLFLYTISQKLSINLDNATSLTELNTAHNTGSLNGLNNLTNLVSLRIHSPLLYSSYIIKLPQLTHLSITNYGNINIINIAGLTSLARLETYNIHMDNKQVENLIHLTYLDAATKISSYGLTDKGFERLTKLRILRLSGWPYVSINKANK